MTIPWHAGGQGYEPPPPASGSHCSNVRTLCIADPPLPSKFEGTLPSFEHDNPRKADIAFLLKKNRFDINKPPKNIFLNPHLLLEGLVVELLQQHHGQVKGELGPSPADGGGDVG